MGLGSGRTMMSRRDLVKAGGVAAVGVAAGVFSARAFAAEGSGSASGDGSTSSSSGSAGTVGKLNTGTYVGVGDGRNGPIVVRTTMSRGNIESIEIVAENETHNIGSIPIETYPGLMVKSQTLNVDTVTGATITCMGIAAAVADCISQAGGDPDDYAAPDVSQQHAVMDETVDVAVIGSGGAGLTAAIRAAEAGKKVIVLEKLSVVGGTSNYSIEGFGAVGDKAHVALGCPTDAAALASSLIEKYPDGDPDVLTLFANSNGAGADWLRSIGCEMTCAAGQTSAITSREVGKLGVTVVAALKAEAAKLGIQVETGCKVTEILMDGGAVSGVKVTSSNGDFTVSAGAVVIASGGFAANLDMCVEYQPSLEGLLPACCIGDTGDGHEMASALGASLSNLDYIRVNFYYTTAPSGAHYYMGCLFNTGAIFVNAEGKRFVNEQGAYGVGYDVVDAGGTGWAVFDSSIVNGSEDVRGYGKLGLYTQADTIADLAAAMGVDAGGLQDTIDTYVGYVKAGEDADFGRGMLNMTFDEPPFFACPLECRLQGTFGGIDTDIDAHVLDASGNPIAGLFAAGECANDGTWGVNPASVNIVFGGIAGTNAAAYVG